MKTTQKYQADDGKIFNSAEECEKYEKILKQISVLLETLPNPDKYNIFNGDGYIQHPKGTYEKIEKELVRLSNIWFNQKEKFTNFNYYLGRLIDDSNMNCLNKLSYRLKCINNEREYGQPYFAINPHKAKNIQVN